MLLDYSLDISDKQLSEINGYQCCILGKMNLLIMIKSLDLCGPFSVTFSAKKEHLADVRFTICICLFRALIFLDLMLNWTK